MSITTTYKGYTLAFYEHNEHWACTELDVDSETLAACKARIDDLTRNDRRLKVPAFYVSGGSGQFSNNPKIEKVTVTLLAAKRERRHSTYNDTEQVHIEKPNGDRDKVRCDAVYPLEAFHDLNRWATLCAVAEAARLDAHAAAKAITHYTHDTLALANREAKAKAEA